MILSPDIIRYYGRVRQNPYRRAGLRLDRAIEFCDDIAKELDKLSELQRDILFGMAMGYTQKEISIQLGIPTRTMVRRIADMRQLPNVIFPKEWRNIYVRNTGEHENPLDS